MGVRARGRARPYRRRILVAGIAVGVIAGLGGGPWYVGRVERDLERRVRAAATGAGLDGVAVTASGQDVRLDCDAALDDPQLAAEVAADVRGVRGIEIDRSCRVDESSSTTSDEPATATTATSSPADSAPTTSVASAGPTGEGEGDAAGFSTVVDLLSAAPSFSIVAGLIEDAGLAAELRALGPFTVLAPTNEAFAVLPVDAFAAVRADPDVLAALLRNHVLEGAVAAADLSTAASPSLDGVAVLDHDLAAGNGMVHAIDTVLVPDDPTLDALAAPLLRAELAGGRLRLSGVVASAGQRDLLVAAATLRLAPANVDDALVIDDAATVDDLAVEAYAAVVGVLPGNLAEATATSGRGGHVVTGTYLGPDGLATLEATASVVDARLALSPRPAATAADVAALSDELDAVLTATPIRFAPGAVAPTAASAAALDRVAGLIGALAGTLVTIEGHTDTTGNATLNVAVSEARAQAVVEALVLRGVPQEQLVAIGLGEQAPVLVDGVEDQAASRRVAIRVERAA